MVLWIVMPKYFAESTNSSLCPCTIVHVIACGRWFTFADHVEAGIYWDETPFASQIPI